MPQLRPLPTTQISLGGFIRGVGDFILQNPDIIPGDIDTTIAGGLQTLNPPPGAQPILPGGSCSPGFVLDPVTGNCVPVRGFGTGGVPTGPTPQIPGSPGIITPAERSIGAVTGFIAPSLTNRLTAVCPRIAGKGSILHFNPMTGQEVCLPRGVNGSSFGLVRKWAKPKTQAQMDAKKLRVAASVKSRVKKLAMAAGFKCSAKGSRGR